MIFRKKTFVSLAYVMASTTLFSGTAMAAGAGPMERNIERASSDTVTSDPSSSAQVKHHHYNRRIDSINSVRAKTETESSSYRFDHTSTGIDIHGGLSLATLGGTAIKSEDSLKSNIGFEIGAGYDYELSSTFSARPEINLIQKGYGVSYGDGVDGSFNMYYIEVPLLMKASTDIGNIRSNLVAGPSVAVNVGNTVEAHYQNSSYSVSADSSDSGFKKLDYGLQFGGGVEVPTNNSNAIVADLRYDLGLANIYKYSADGQVKTRTLLFTMGFKF